jgi:hypothetical protein
LHSGTILVLDEPFLVGFDPEGIAKSRAGLRMLVPRNVEPPLPVIFEVHRAIGFELWNRDWAVTAFPLNFHPLGDSRLQGPCESTNQSGRTGCRSNRSSCSMLNGFRSTGRCCKDWGSFSRAPSGSAVMIAIF